jgi:hypothetical protein
MTADVSGSYPPGVDFEIEHSFAADPDRVAAAMLDQAFQNSLRSIGPLADREVLSQEQRPDGTVFRRIRCVLGIKLPSAAKTILGDSEPAWVEEATWDPIQRRWSWEIRPEVAKELLRSGGTIALDANGDGTIRRIEGHVQVRVPIYGSRVEPVIVDGLKAAYAEETARLEEWLSTR